MNIITVLTQFYYENIYYHNIITVLKLYFKMQLWTDFALNAHLRVLLICHKKQNLLLGEYFATRFFENERHTALRCEAVRKPPITVLFLY